MVPRPRVLIGDDHLATAALLRELLQPEFDVIATVTDGPTLVRFARQLAPDAIVSDISMPGLDGLCAATAILQDNPDARIVFMTVHADPALVARALAIGAFGYVLKLSAGDELIPAIHAAIEGRQHVCVALRFEEGAMKRMAQ